jgi:NAD(P)-dependent dehydrogenase (short-subunit alcohol dehydrogenase family)
MFAACCSLSSVICHLSSVICHHVLMPWTVSQLPDLSGKVVVVTGGNGGLGFETVKALSGKGAHVVLASRKIDRAQEAADSIRTVHPDASLEVAVLDLSSQESVRSFASEILDRHPSIDVVVCNAGIMGTPEARSVDGFDMQFATNHLGHFALTALLWPALAAGSGGRVVTVTSFGRHMRGTFDPVDPPLQGDYDRWRVYGQTKMANLRFALEIDRRARASGVEVTGIAAHPGLSHTRLLTTRPPRNPQGRVQRFWGAFIARFGMNADRGALSQIRGAGDLKVRGGRLYGPLFTITGRSVRRPLMPWTRRSHRLTELWDVSERLTGIRFKI